MMNVLAAALQVIPTQKITYKKWIGLSPNSIGIMRNTYANPVTVDGSIQPASDDTLYKLGISNTGDIYTCYLRGNAVSIADLQSNDVIIGANGEEYNIFRSDKWSGYPGQDWNRIFIRRKKNYV